MGVADLVTYQVKRLDEDYFEERRTLRLLAYDKHGHRELSPNFDQTTRGKYEDSHPPMALRGDERCVWRAYFRPRDGGTPRG